MLSSYGCGRLLATDKCLNKCQLHQSNESLWLRGINLNILPDSLTCGCCNPVRLHVVKLTKPSITHPLNTEKGPCFSVCLPLASNPLAFCTVNTQMDDLQTEFEPFLPACFLSKPTNLNVSPQQHGSQLLAVIQGRGRATEELRSGPQPFPWWSSLTVM